MHLFNTAQPEGRIASLSHTGRITAIAFSDDGKYMATASSNPHAYRIEEEGSYPMRVWYLEPADLIAEARRRLAPFLTEEKAARPPE